MSKFKTSILFLSDTHGQTFPPGREFTSPIDVVVHSGDLTEGSSLGEFHTTLEMLKRFEAPLKLVIAGNHDFTLDTPAFERKIAEAVPSLDTELVVQHYGNFGQARQIFDHARKNGIVFLDEGHHSFVLENGARLNVYATPYTPSYGTWGFQYHPEAGREFKIQKDVDIVISHGPPKGILDRTGAGERAGCPDLFAAVARARPRVHCFGHIHESWGARRVIWRRQISKNPSHFTDIDNERSELIETLTRRREAELCDSETIEDHNCSRHSLINNSFSECDLTTTFINSSIQGAEGTLTQKPWVIDIDLDVSENS